MSTQLLVLSEKQNDIDFWQKIAEREGLLFKNVCILEEVVKTLQNDPSSIILWDAESNSLKGLEQYIVDMGLSSRVFVVSDSPAHSFPGLFDPRAFSHHLTRRYDENAEFLCSQLIKNSIAARQTIIDGYFKNYLARKKVTLTSSTQKQTTVDSFLQFLLDHQIPARIAEVSADAADELLMNAIFDAPKNSSGQHYRRKFERHSDFELAGREIVEAEVIINSELIGIRVVDQFGSLNFDSTLRSLGKNFTVEEYVLSDEDPGAGLGISKLVKNALSLSFLVNPGISTESVALIGNTRNYKKLRESFSFFSVQASNS